MGEVKFYCFHTETTHMLCGIYEHVYRVLLKGRSAKAPWHKSEKVHPLTTV